MKRILVYCLLLALVLLVPTERMDIAKLRPVQTVAVTVTGTGCIVATDTGDLGTGTDVVDALEDMRRTTSGIIYLDTADYLLIGEGAQEQARKLKPYMTQSVHVYCFVGSPDLQKVSQYLQIHGSGVRFSEWEKETRLPVLDGRGERLKLL